MKKRGLSNTLAVVLIILLVIVGIILIWIYLRQSVTESSERVEMQGKCYGLEVDLQNCEYGGPLGTTKWFVSGIVRLKDGDPTDIRIAFYDKGGSSKTRDLKLIRTLETKKILPPTVITRKPEYAVASPIVYSRDGTKSMVCPITRRVPCNDVGFRGNLCELPTSIEDIDPFVKALGQEADYNEAFPNCDRSNADFNCDGQVDHDDTDYFSKILENGWLLCNKTMICEFAGAPDWLSNNEAVGSISSNCV